MSETPAKIRRIAMWSGPRNISTALMRSFGNRADTYVCDEPLYAHYLKHTGYDHPGADQIIQHHETDWPKVIQELTGPLQNGHTIYYQKQMAQHMLDHIDRKWLDLLDHVFLIRNPLRVILSYHQIMGEVSLDAIGLPQQVEIFNRVIEKTGTIPPVIDSDDIQANPESIIRQLCQKLDIDFTENMLNWPTGRRSTDGIWAKYWYDKVYESTWFRPNKPQPKPNHVPEPLAKLAEEAEPYYRQLYKHRLIP